MKVTSVLGDIDSANLGMTSMHDHTFLDMHTAAEYMEKLFSAVPPFMRELKPENYGFFKSGSYLVCKELQQVDDLPLLVKEYGYFKGMGGSTVCDPSPIGIRGDIRKVQELSKQTGLNIISATGLYHETAIAPEYRNQSEEYYYNLFKNEIEHGIDGTEIRPGFLKGALAATSETEINIVNACIHLSAETNLSVHIHTEPTVPGERILEIVDAAVEKYQANPEKILICHMDNRLTIGVSIDQYLTGEDYVRNIDLSTQRAILDKGYNIGLDTWGPQIVNDRVMLPDAFDRLKALVSLLNAGYEKQIVLGNDFSDLLQTRTYGGFGTTRVFDLVIPKLKQLGMEDKLEYLLYKNPQRILEY